MLARRRSEAHLEGASSDEDAASARRRVAQPGSCSIRQALVDARQHPRKQATAEDECEMRGQREEERDVAGDVE